LECIECSGSRRRTGEANTQTGQNPDFGIYHDEGKLFSSVGNSGIQIAENGQKKIIGKISVEKVNKKGRGEGSPIFRPKSNCATVQLCSCAAVQLCNCAGGRGGVQNQQVSESAGQREPSASLRTVLLVEPVRHGWLFSPSDYEYARKRELIGKPRT
jgi:hypothetical protein